MTFLGFHLFWVILLKDIFGQDEGGGIKVKREIISNVDFLYNKTKTFRKNLTIRLYVYEFLEDLIFLKATKISSKNLIIFYDQFSLHFLQI